MFCSHSQKVDSQLMSNQATEKNRLKKIVHLSQFNCETSTFCPVDQHGDYTFSCETWVAITGNCLKSISSKGHQRSVTLLINNLSS